MPQAKSIERLCKRCGAIFFVNQNQITQGRGIHCSRACAGSSRRGQTRPKRPLAERFWAKVNKTDGCWLWTGKIKGGRRPLAATYGVVVFGRKGRLAHRVAWELTNGPIPDGMCVLHNCPSGDNPRCVNPAHLWLGTQAENNTDRSLKGRDKPGRGEENYQTTLTNDQVRTFRIRVKMGTPQSQIVKETGLSKATISAMMLYKTWRCVE